MMESGLSFINWSISLGTIIELASVILGGTLFVATINKRIDKIDRELEQVRELLTKTAVIDARLLATEADVRELRHGRGFVVDPRT